MRWGAINYLLLSLTWCPRAKLCLWEGWQLLVDCSQGHPQPICTHGHQGQNCVCEKIGSYWSIAATAICSQSVLMDTKGKTVFVRRLAVTGRLQPRPSAAKLYSWTNCSAIKTQHFPTITVVQGHLSIQGISPFFFFFFFQGGGSHCRSVRLAPRLLDKSENKHGHKQTKM